MQTDPNYAVDEADLSLTGTDQDDMLVDGPLNDTLEGGDGNDHLTSFRGADVLSSGDGDDMLVSRSDAGEPAPAQGIAARGRLQGDEDAEGRAHGYDLPTETDDILTGGAGADMFMFRGDIDARIKIAKKHINAAGVINWGGVAGENNNTHDHWVESIGNDTITDFNAAEGDKIHIAAHTVAVTFAQVDADGDGQADDTIITLTSDQGGTADDPNGAHDQDALGTITVLNADAAVVEANTSAHAHALYGTARTLAELVAANAVAQGEAVNVRGRSAADRIVGGATDDTIAGRDGHDSLFGGGGNDVIRGGTGNDTIDGGDGDDKLVGGTGRDQITGGDGNDTIKGQSDHDNLSGEDGNDLINGGSGNDTIDGGEGKDRLTGGRGRDQITGGDGNDTINGHSDHDRLSGGDGNDQINGGSGNDTIDGGEGNDLLTGGRGRDQITGGDGNDQINGGGGNDIIDGGDGDDLLTGGGGRDRLTDGAGNDALIGGGDHDVLSSFLGADTLEGGRGNDRLESRSDAGEPTPAQTGGAGDRINQDFNPTDTDDVLTGGSGADTFYFRLDINATEEAAARHTMENGMIHWHGVAGENDNVHDHWVEAIGNDTITDYNTRQDSIVIEGHTVAVSFAMIDADDDGAADDTLITLTSDQGGTIANPNGAHDQDALGTITVLNAALDADDITVDAGVHYGAFDTLEQLQLGWA